jgi:predicted molibdopterin-dependent oxidoreductase YjgC
LIFSELAKLWPAISGEPKADVKKSKRKAGDAPKAWGYANAQAVLDEICRAAPMYDKLTWAALGSEGVQWPAAGLPAGLRRLALPERRSLPQGGADYPYALAAGRVLFDGGTLLRQTEVAGKVAAPAAVSINPADAAREKLAGGQMATVSSAAGQLTLAVQVDESVQPGTLWIPYSLPGAPVETLLASASDGVGARVRIAAAA